MKKLLIGALTAILGGGASLTLVAARYEPTLRPNSTVGGVDVSGLTPTEAAFAVRRWWEQERRRKLDLESDIPNLVLEGRTPGQLGVRVDDAASVAQVPMQEFGEAIRERLRLEEYAPIDYAVKYAPQKVDLKDLAKEIEVAQPVRPARARWTGAVVQRTAETEVRSLDAAAIYDRVVQALENGEDSIEVPLRTTPKRVPDEALSEITEIVASFTTHFPAGQVDRNANIRLAASRFDGQVLLPGEKISFNDTVGRRTLQAGYRMAGVYRQGRHDTGIGGGICQVSTTLYNAALFADLEIGQRQNHSMPVAYVPVGRDATVDYGSIDLIIENSLNKAISIQAFYAPGSLTVRVLGEKSPGKKVRVVSGPIRSWARGEQVVADPKVRPGQRLVVEKGSPGYQVQTFRYVYDQGKLVRRDNLGRSHYPGGPKIVAVAPVRRPNSPNGAQSSAPGAPTGRP